MIFFFLIMLPGLIARIGWLESVSDWLSVHASQDVYTAVLTTVAATGVAFLSLYFTALSVVVGASSPTLSRAVHILAIEEKIGSTYLKFVAHLAVFSLLALALTSLGVDRSRSVLIYTSVCAGVGIFAFIPLGRRIFAFFDPSLLVRAPARDFIANLEEVTAVGARPLLPSFQRFFRNQALRALTALNDITEHALFVPHPTMAAVRAILVRLLDLIVINASRSSRIPSESLWFERVGQFQPVSLTDMTQASLTL